MTVLNRVYLAMESMVEAVEDCDCASSCCSDEVDGLRVAMRDLDALTSLPHDEEE